MGKASEDELGAMHGVIARGLTEVLAHGVTIGATDGGEPIKATAPAAYFAAAIAFAKNNNITADAGTNADLKAFSEQLSKRRKEGKGRLSQQQLEEAADTLDRDLGGHML